MQLNPAKTQISKLHETPKAELQSTVWKYVLCWKDALIRTFGATRSLTSYIYGYNFAKGVNS